MCKRFSKPALMILLFCLPAGNLWADSRQVSSSMTEVIVYQNRARVIREATLFLTEGDHSLLFENIPILSDETSFHASATGSNEPLMLGLSHRIEEHLSASQEKAAGLEKEILNIEQGRKSRIDYKLDVLERRNEFLLSIMNQTGETMSNEVKSGSVNVGNWNDAYHFFGNNLETISDSLRELRLWSSTIKDTVEILKRRLESIRSTRANTTRTVQIDLRLESEGEIVVGLDYIVSNATWKPIYDARLNTQGDTTAMELFAEITQKTGEDWEDVKLTLSTAEPARSAGPGEIEAWNIGEIIQAHQNRNNESEQANSLDKVIRVTAEKKGIDKYLTDSRVTVSRKEIEMMPVQNVDELLQQPAGVATNNEGEIVIRGGRIGEVAHVIDGVRVGDPVGNFGPIDLGLSIEKSPKFATTFETSRDETVFSGDRAARAPIARWLLESKVNLICRPKLNEAVFRQVEITNQNNYPLLSGQVNLFAGSNFIGKTYLHELIAPGETFELPFGIDNGFNVERKIISNKKSVSNDKIKITMTLEIRLKNWSKFIGTLVLEEPFPVSQDNRLKVKYENIAPKPDDINKLGKANWNLSLEPDEEKSVYFTFEISYPKELRISGI